MAQDIYICSDIHGRLTEYQEALKRVGNNRLYILGDCIDRHPDGVTILLDIMHRDNVTLLMGNHEWMMFNSLFAEQKQMDIWCSPNNGGVVTLRSLMHAIDEKKVTLKEFCDFLLSCPLFVDFGGVYLCHGMPHFALFDADFDKEVASFDKPHIYTLQDGINDNINPEYIHIMVWHSVFKDIYEIQHLEQTRKVKTTVYSGHVIDVYSDVPNSTEDGLPISVTNDGMLTCIDIDGGCAFPFDLGYDGHLNLLNITKGTYERIESK